MLADTTIISRIQRIIAVKRWSWKKNDIEPRYVKPFAITIFVAGLLFAGIALIYVYWSVASQILQLLVPLLVVFVVLVVMSIASGVHRG